MNLLIQSATIIDQESAYHGKTLDILIKDGKVAQIGNKLDAEGIDVFKAENLHLSRGWIDLQANFQDPGYEQKEDFESGRLAAAKGGFSRVCLSPLTNPVRDSKSQVEYVSKHQGLHAVDLLPYGSVSKQAEGKELAELFDMHEAGAIAFFDGKHSLKNPNLIHRALLYTQAFNGLVINFPHTAELANGGVMNEGETSTILGLKGIPELTEELMISRDLYLLEYTEGKMHFATISSKKGLDLIAKAQAQGLNVSCDVSAAHLLIEDKELSDFDSRFKTLPPFRTKDTINHFIEGLKQEAITSICSDHWPEDIEAKKKEFDHASFGLINLQTAFASARTATDNEISLDQLISCFTTGPAAVLGLESNPIEEGCKANFSLFDPDAEFVFNKEMVASKAKNSPFFGRSLKGKVYGIVNNNQKALFE